MTEAIPVQLNDPAIKRSAAIAKALGHPARIAILKFWPGKPPASAGILPRYCRWHNLPFRNI